MELRWKKSSKSGQGSNCVEVASTLTGLRDSKNQAGPVLRFANPDAVSRLLEAIKRGEL